VGADLDALEIDFPASIARAYPEAFAYAWPATEQVLRNITGADLSRLARRSPALAGFAWTGYLRCSAVRLVRALDGLWRLGVRRGRVLDLGSYFGNASLMCRAAGYDVDALDAYGEYHPAFDSCVSAMRAAGVTVRDFTDAGPDFVLLPAASYDAVLCLGCRRARATHATTAIEGHRSAAKPRWCAGARHAEHCVSLKPPATGARTKHHGASRNPVLHGTAVRGASP
jgi:hypothetical protein